MVTGACITINTFLYGTSFHIIVITKSKQNIATFITHIQNKKNCKNTNEILNELLHENLMFLQVMIINNYWTRLSKIS